MTTIPDKALLEALLNSEELSEMENTAFQEMLRHKNDLTSRQREWAEAVYDRLDLQANETLNLVSSGRCAASTSKFPWELAPKPRKPPGKTGRHRDVQVLQDVPEKHMRIRVVSDLHLDLHKDGGRQALRQITSGNFDLLAIAGDLAAFPYLRQALDLVMKHTHQHVLYVPGNHDFYNSTWEATWQTLNQAEQTHNKLHILDQKELTINGTHFTGATLWFPYPKPTPWDHCLGDFHAIQNIRAWVDKQATAARKWLQQTITPSSIVITHHMPHVGSIAPEYTNSPLNRFFLHNLGDKVVSRPTLWIHGHTHMPMDYKVGQCRVLCNPLGYPTENNSFRADLTWP